MFFFQRPLSYDVLKKCSLIYAIQISINKIKKAFHTQCSKSNPREFGSFLSTRTSLRQLPAMRTGRESFEIKIFRSSTAFSSTSKMAVAHDIYIKQLSTCILRKLSCYWQRQALNYKTPK